MLGLRSEAGFYIRGTKLSTFNVPLGEKCRCFWVGDPWSKLHQHLQHFQPPKITEYALCLLLYVRLKEYSEFKALSLCPPEF